MRSFWPKSNEVDKDATSKYEGKEVLLSIGELRAPEQGIEKVKVDRIMNKTGSRSREGVK